MYIPWQYLDVVKQGRERWNRRKTITARYGLHMDPFKWSVEPRFAPMITAYGVLIARVYHKYTVTYDCHQIFKGFTYNLLRILAKRNISNNDYSRSIAQHSWLRGSVGYAVASDLFNSVVGRSNSTIVAASTRLAESNLSLAQRKAIEDQIRKSNRMICFYDFDRNNAVDEIDLKLFSEDYGRALSPGN